MGKKNEWDFVFRGEHPEYYGMNALKEKRKPNSKRPVRCITDGQEFVSIRKAADNYRVHSSAISKHLKKNKMYTHVGKLQFEYMN